MGLESTIFLGKGGHSACWGQVFGTGNDLFRLVSHLDGYHVGFAASLTNDAHSTMVASVGHSLVNGRFDQDRYFLPWFVYPQDSA